jgi:hypothetical protein
MNGVPARYEKNLLRVSGGRSDREGPHAGPSPAIVSFASVVV